MGISRGSTVQPVNCSMVSTSCAPNRIRRADETHSDDSSLTPWNLDLGSEQCLYGMGVAVHQFIRIFGAKKGIIQISA